MSFPILKDFVSKLDDITFLSSISNLDCYDHNLFLKPYFWKLMVGTFKKTLANPNRRSVASLCARLKEVYFQRLARVTQTSFVRFFQNRIYSRVYVFSKVLLNHVKPILEQDTYKDSSHEELITLPVQQEEEIISVLKSNPDSEISNVDKFFNEYPYLLVYSEPRSDGKYLVYKDDIQVYEDLDSYYEELVRNELVTQPELEVTKKKKKKSKKFNKKVSFETFFNNDWETDDEEDQQSQSLAGTSAFQEIDHFAFGNDVVDHPISQFDISSIATEFVQNAELPLVAEHRDNSNNRTSPTVEELPSTPHIGRIVGEFEDTVNNSRDPLSRTISIAELEEALNSNNPPF